MRVFLTGATGFIGSRVLPELLAAGHSVLGLTRSEAGVRRLREAGADAHRGTLEDPRGLAQGAAGADAVIHTAFDHDFTGLDRFQQNCDKDGRVIEALGAVLAGSDRPLIVTSGTGMGAARPGDVAKEDVLDLDNPNPRIATERTLLALAERGVSTAAVRLPQVHDAVKQGLITYLVVIAREKGASAYVGEGAARWPAAHVGDVARLYRLALEHHRPGARWHAVAEEGVTVRQIAEVIGKGLGAPVRSVPPEEAEAQFGWMGVFAGFDMPASSAWTRERLGWRPTGSDLLTDLRAMDYGVLSP